MSPIHIDSIPSVRRPIGLALLCAGLLSSPVLMSAAVAAPVALASVTAGPTTASSDGTNLSIRIRYTGTPAWVRVYIDNDAVTTTGYAFNGVGAGYMIENGRLYRYSGSNGAWAWTFV